jgi:PhnB protein
MWTAFTNGTVTSRWRPLSRRLKFMAETSPMQVQPYLFFDGRCDEAIAFYRDALGAEVQMLMRFKEAPPMEGQGPDCPGTRPEMAEKVMHAAVRIGLTEVLMSDGMCAGKPQFAGVSLTITADNDAAAERLFQALEPGGTVQMPMAPTFFASRFGIVQDRFGVSWMVIVPLIMPHGVA